MWSETLPYRDHREPYAPAFFPETAKRLGLTRRHRMLDLACGTGTLAFNFAPYVGTLTGVDVEQPMLDAARAEAAQRGIDIDLICSTVENMPDTIGPFDLVTIGKAHWYLPPQATRAMLDRMVAPEGKIVICFTGTDDVRSGPWAPVYRELRRNGSYWQRPQMSSRQLMGGSSFTHIEEYRDYCEGYITVDQLVMRALAYPGTTPEYLGADTHLFVARLREGLNPFAVDGKLRDVVLTRSIVFSRP